MTMPKLIIAGASDEFFLVDDSHYFLEDLPGESLMWYKYIRVASVLMCWQGASPL